VKGGASKNSFVVGDAGHNLDNLPAHLSIQGGSAQDSLVLDDRGPADPLLTQIAAAFSITGGDVTRTETAIASFQGLQIPRTFTTSSSTTGDVVRSTTTVIAILHQLQIPRTFTTAIDYSSTMYLTVQGGAGKNSFVVGDASHNLDNLPAHLSIQGGGAQDSLVL